MESGSSIKPDASSGGYSQRFNNQGMGASNILPRKVFIRDLFRDFESEYGRNPILGGSAIDAADEFSK